MEIRKRKVNPSVIARPSKLVRGNLNRNNGLGSESATQRLPHLMRSFAMTSFAWLLVLTLLIQSALAVTVNVRIEAPSKTIFSGNVNVSESVIVKDSGGVNHTYSGYKEINALVAASNKGNFPFIVSDSPWGLSLDSIDGISSPAFAWWNQRINWSSAMLGISSQPLADKDNVLLHLTGTESNPWSTDQPLSISVSANKLKGNEAFTIKTTYFDDTASVVKPIKATVNIGSTKIETDADGNLTTSLPKGGVYEIFAEKTDYVRSQREQVVVGNVVTAEQSKASINKALNFLRKKQGYSGGIENASITAWVAIAFNAANIDPNKVKITKNISKKKQRSLVDYLKTYTKNILKKSGKKSNPKDIKPLATDFARQIMAVVASKQNPRNFAGVDLIKGLRSYFNNGQFGEKGLINDDIFALIALRAANVTSRDKQYRKALSYVLKHQNSDGGFSYSATSTGYSENDTTSSAIQALLLAKRAGVKGVTSSINKAYKYLLTNQLADGGFHYNSVYNKSNAQSTAWATMAIISKNGVTAPDSLTTVNGSTPGYYAVGLQRGNGGFAYDALGQSDAWTTTQVIPALAKRPWLSKK